MYKKRDSEIKNVKFAYVTYIDGLLLNDLMEKKKNGRYSSSGSGSATTAALSNPLQHVTWK